ncbi:MAG: protein kinase [Planctomycetota bacterium]|nr:protein kinase [Planctomycetota bacterium]
MDKKKWGDYEILGVLGKGAQGVVYKARQPLLDRLVAIKTLPLDVAADESFIARFTREAKNIARLSHPNIVHVYDMSTFEGTYYYVMEYVEGEDLGKILKRGIQLSWEQMVDVLRQVAAALDAASEQNMVHRDIKPENIMITAKGQVKVADFGLAKITGAGANVTREGLILGTVNYMAPEQAKGQECDIRSDLYSLGVVMYRMISGKLPFSGENLQSIIFKHINDEPLDPLQHNASIPPSLARICLKLLHKRPERRYQTPSELIRALSSVSLPSVRTAVMEQVEIEKYVEKDADGKVDHSEAYSQPEPESTPHMKRLHAIEKKKARKKSRVNVFIAVFFVLLAGLFAAYLYDKNSNNGEYVHELLLMAGLATASPTPASSSFSPSARPSEADVRSTPPPVGTAVVTLKVEPAGAVVTVLSDGEPIPLPPRENASLKLEVEPGTYSVKVEAEGYVTSRFDFSVSEDGEVTPREEMSVKLTLTEERKLEQELSASFEELSSPDDCRRFRNAASAAAMKYPENQFFTGFVELAEKRLKQYAQARLEKAEVMSKSLKEKLDTLANVDLKELNVAEVMGEVDASISLWPTESARELKTLLNSVANALESFNRAEVAENEAIAQKAAERAKMLIRAKNLYRRFIADYGELHYVAALREKAEKRASNIERKLSRRDNFLAWLDELEEYAKEIGKLVEDGEFEKARRVSETARKVLVAEKPDIDEITEDMKKRMREVDRLLADVLPARIEKGLRNRLKVVLGVITSFEKALREGDLDAVAEHFEPSVRAKMTENLRSLFSAGSVATRKLENDPSKKAVIGNDRAKLYLIWIFEVECAMPDGRTEKVLQRVFYEIQLVYSKDQWMITDLRALESDAK